MVSPNFGIDTQGPHTTCKDKQNKQKRDDEVVFHGTKIGKNGKSKGRVGEISVF